MIHFHVAFFHEALLSFKEGPSARSSLLYCDKKILREVIRAALAVAPRSILADRELRDSWMHFDERLDRAFLTETFRERHRFVRSSKAAALIASTVTLLEVDTLVVHYTNRAGAPASLDLSLLEQALVQIREALRKTIAG